MIKLFIFSLFLAGTALTVGAFSFWGGGLTGTSPLASVRQNSVSINPCPTPQPNALTNLSPTPCPPRNRSSSSGRRYFQGGGTDEGK